jgi:hypothetical protein
MKDTIIDIAAWTVVIVCCPIWLPIKLIKDARPRRRRRCATASAREALERLQEERRQDYEDYLKVNTPKPFNTRRRALSRSRIHPDVNKTCQFLRQLPPEIRSQIYEYVLGGQTFHLVQVPRRIAHVRCDRNYDDGTDLFDATRKCFPLARNRFSPSSPVYDQSQQTQGEVWKRYGPLILNSLSTSNLALLRTCRQIYQEGIHILYRSNVFDFDSIMTFLNFTANLSPERLATIRHLQIRSEFHNCRHLSSWSYYIAPPFMANNYLHDTWDKAWHTIATSMPGLTHLNLFVDSSGHSTPRNVNEKWLGPILQVRGLKEFDLVVKEKGKYLDPKTDKEMKALLRRLRAKLYRKRIEDVKVNEKKDGQEKRVVIEVEGVEKGEEVEIGDQGQGDNQDAITPLPVSNSAGLGAP